jgi:short-subunit dehydrogenase involved in D-alanine esterification of teichoic acids
MKPTGNTILVTGGTSGIGLGLALRLHDAGNTVIITGRRKEQLDQLAAEHPGLHTQQLDVTDPQSIATAFEAVTAAWPDLNVLVNNAGVMLPEQVLDPAALPVAETTIATNLLGPIRMVSAFGPFLATKPDAAILNVSSGLAFVPLPLTPTYNATKAAIHSFSESLRVQLSGPGVQVIEIVPPAVRTPLMNQTDDETAMPLDEFLSEAMSLLTSTPDAKEICVERVKPLRHAVANGNYDVMLGYLSAYQGS